MSAKPPRPKPAAKPLEAAAKPAEIVGHTIERALDPLAAALKRAALKRADKQSRQFAAASAAPAAPPARPGAKAAALLSPLAVPFPKIAPIAGVELATGRAGFYKTVRDDVLVMRLAEGATCAGVFTRHAVGSAPVDWCKRQLEASGGDEVRALVVNAG